MQLVHQLHPVGALFEHISGHVRWREESTFFFEERHHSLHNEQQHGRTKEQLMCVAVAVLDSETLKIDSVLY